MKISLNWIKEYVNLDGIDVADLLNKFTLSVAEIEGVEELGKELSGIVTAKIVSVEEHPNSKKLHVLKVDTGEQELTDVVCGAPNCRVGVVVPFAKIGANVNGFAIGKAKLAGVDSCGMCCSGKEVGVSDNHDGLWELPSNTKLGVDIKQLYPISDTVFEVDNKSLTNRPDLWGHYGIAREIAALVNRPLKPVTVADLETYHELPQLDISVSSNDCLRYTGLRVENITQKVSNETMQIRLHYTGLRPINLLTDLTNYLMLELGQPMHAFDNAKVQNVQVYNLTDSERFLTLDGVTRTLPNNTLVIATNNTPVAVAGIMGGELSGISNTTNSVLLESANFDATVIRKTAVAIGLRSESSARYEKTLDPELTTLALGRYVYLLQQQDKGAKVTSSVTDKYQKHYESVTISITKSYIDRYIGMELKEEQILDILNRLEFGVLNNGNGNYEVSVPSFRATKDVKLPCDLVEEITRIYGYDNIVPVSTEVKVKPQKLNPVVDQEYRAKYLLASKFDLNEIHSYLWYDTATNQELGLNPVSVVRLVNALNKENSELRSTIVPSLLKVLNDNKTSHETMGVFEIGRVAAQLQKDGLVKEERRLGVALYSKTENQSDLLVKAKNIASYLIDLELNLQFKVLPKTNTVDYYHPVNNYEVWANGESVGEIAMLHPVVKNNLHPNANVAVLELNFDKLVEMKPHKIKFQKGTKYPVSEFDYSFVVPNNTLYSQIYSIATSLKTPLSYQVSYVDVFALDETQKALTINVKVWSQDHTLTSEELYEFYNSMLTVFEQNNIHIKKVEA